MAILATPECERERSPPAWAGRPWHVVRMNSPNHVFPLLRRWVFALYKVWAEGNQHEPMTAPEAGVRARYHLIPRSVVFLGYPLYVIRPFRHQGPRELAVLGLFQARPWIELASVVCRPRGAGFALAPRTVAVPSACWRRGGIPRLCFRRRLADQCFRVDVPSRHASRLRDDPRIQD